MIDSLSCIPFHLQHLILTEVAIKESCSYTLTSAILKSDVVCRVAMTSTPNDRHMWRPIQQMYWQHMLFLFFIYPMGPIRVCKIRFVSTGANCGKPYLVCEKQFFWTEPSLLSVCIEDQVYIYMHLILQGVYWQHASSAVVLREVCVLCSISLSDQIFVPHQDSGKFPHQEI